MEDKFIKKMYKYIKLIKKHIHKKKTKKKIIKITNVIYVILKIMI